ncbi:MAG: ABC transporter ATP-binding protein, partial [Chromatiaceae bacterium]|nr:ABC transporter ATP-binding protein [Chromatiaceae bacterium]
TQPANLLVMDEPTNDLDTETLELLEELLLDFQGTLLLVSHDRALLDAVVTSTLVFEGDGRVREYVGGYEDWRRQRPALELEKVHAAKPAKAPAGTTNASAGLPLAPGAKAPAKRDKLGFREQRELEALPARIEALETEVAGIHARMADAAFYQGSGTDISATRDRLGALGTELAAAYVRWEALEALKG